MIKKPENLNLWKKLLRWNHKPDFIKNRPIKYSSHIDSYIFAYYRELLSEKYESILQNRKLSDSVIAYRKIPSVLKEGTGKCNIDFAFEAFMEIQKRKDCAAITLDIESFFESLTLRSVS